MSIPDVGAYDSGTPIFPTTPAHRDEEGPRNGKNHRRPEREPGSDDEDLTARLPRRHPEDYVNAILARAAEPWVCMGLGGAEIVRLRLGSCAALLGGTGAGKSSLVAGIMTEHAKLHGPAVYLSLELGLDELAARVIGMTVGASWEAVLRGQVARDAMVAALPPRLSIFDRDVDDITLDQLGPIVEQQRAEHPGKPILAAFDYVQLAAGDGVDVRMRVSAMAEMVRATAKRLRIALVAVSQTSRAAGRQLRTGELIGAETMSAGAESSAIERAAYVTIAIGAFGATNDEGVTPVELHLGKGRFGGGDRVLPMLYDGETGSWKIAGESKSVAAITAERTAERVAKSDPQRVQAAQDAILAASGRATEPQTRDQLCKAVGTKRELGNAAIDALLKGKDLVECDRPPRSRYPRLWTPRQVAARAAEGAAADALRMGEK